MELRQQVFFTPLTLFRWISLFWREAMGIEGCRLLGEIQGRRPRVTDERSSVGHVTVAPSTKDEPTHTRTQTNNVTLRIFLI